MFSKVNMAVDKAGEILNTEQKHRFDPTYQTESGEYISL